MATFVLTNAFCTINAVALADHTKSITLNYSAEMLDDTVMGCTTRSSLPGLKTWSLEVQFLQDFAAANVDATLWALVGAVAFTVEVRAVNTGRGPTNPGYNAYAVLESYSPLSGGVGELGSTTAAFRPGGGTTATLLRSTS